MCSPVEEGGLGVGTTKEINQALQAKQAWRIVQEPNYLSGSILLPKYSKDIAFLVTMNKQAISLTWKSILHGRDLLT